MRAKKSIIVLLIVLSSLFPFLSNVTAADNITVNISMFGWEKQTNFNKQVIVAGIWHYVNISKSNQNMNEFTFRIYKGYSVPSSANRNETNYYEWEYDENEVTVWADINGYDADYINGDKCVKKGNVYSFCIGIKDTFPNIVGYYENWTIEVYENGNKLDSEDIVVEKPTTGRSITNPSSINFYIDPFTEMTVTGDPYFKLGNSGNMPFYLDIENTDYDDIEIDNINDRLLPDEVRTLYVLLQSKSWPPGKISFDVQLNASYPKTYFLDTNATVTLYPAFVMDVPTLQIYVGHSNYEIIEIENTGITFQYRKKLNMYEGDVKDIKAYVSGDGPVTLEIWADEENVKLLKLLDGTTEKTSPITFISTISSERTITMTIEAISEGTTGVITYKLTTGGIPTLYTTEITIEPPESQKSESFAISLSPVQIIVIILVLVVVIYMLLSYSKHKRR